MPTVRRAFRMSIHTGQADEDAERRHRPIWKDLEETLLAHGVSTYSIYLDEATNDLFAYVERRERRTLGGRRVDGCLPPMVAPHARGDAVQRRQLSGLPHAARGFPPPSGCRT